LNCAICGQPETHLNLNTGKREPVDHPPDTRAIVCSSCMQRLLSSPQDKLKDAYRKAMDAGDTDKAGALERFIDERKNAGETTKPERDPLRRETLRMARIGS
jgi:hypothetical protein